MGPVHSKCSSEDGDNDDDVFISTVPARMESL